MQESIKKVTNIYKCKFFYAGRGPAHASYGLMRAELWQTCRFNF